MAEANDKASDIAAEARIEARHVIGKIKHEIEECKNEMNTLILERRRFLRESEELVATFAHMIEDSVKKVERNSSEGKDSTKQELGKPDGRMTLSFSPITASSLDDDEVAIS